VDSIFEFLFVFGALGVWIVQRLVKRSRQQAARSEVGESDTLLLGDDDDDNFLPADEWQPEVALLPVKEDRDVPVYEPPAPPTDEPRDDDPPARHPRVTPRFAGRSLRDAVIMSEVLRRPKALR
jgi:hypothetical protein